MAPKRTYHEFCQTCGQRLATLGERYVSLHMQCPCSPPGPPAVPHSVEKVNVIFVPGTEEQLQAERDAKKPGNGTGLPRDATTKASAAFLRPGDATAKTVGIESQADRAKREREDAARAGIMPNHHGVDDCRTVGVEGKVVLPDAVPAETRTDAPVSHDPLESLEAPPRPKTFTCGVCKQEHKERDCLQPPDGDSPSICDRCVYAGLLWAAEQARKAENAVTVGVGGNLSG